MTYNFKYLKVFSNRKLFQRCSIANKLQEVQKKVVKKVF